MTKIKICGLSRLEDVERWNRALPITSVCLCQKQAAGQRDTARFLRSCLDVRIKPVGVFVNDAPERSPLCAAGASSTSFTPRRRRRGIHPKLRALTDRP
jgi:phosphoribosylanthranilate isomerase